MLTHTLGYPRIGLRRELKKAVEGFWNGTVEEADLLQIVIELRQRHWQEQHEAGIGLLPVGDFSLYDQVLDMSASLGAVPKRYGWTGSEIDLALYFRMARGSSGTGGVRPMEMSKWFDTNYHYTVPELTAGMTFTPSPARLLEQLAECTLAAPAAKAVLIGPVTYLALGKCIDPGLDRWSLLPALLEAYHELIRAVAAQVEWIQIDEPLLVTDFAPSVRQAYQTAYASIRKAAGSAKLLLTTYFGGLGVNRDLALSLPVDGLHIDLVRAPGELPAILENDPDNRVLSLGIVNGRNIWRVDPDVALPLIAQATDVLGRDRVWLAPSCSLLHAPMDLDAEEKLDPALKQWMAFAKQKCAELTMLAEAASGNENAPGLADARAAWAARRSDPRTADATVRDRASAVTAEQARRATPFARRKPLQQEHLQLPLFPTTTIGSFPQTPEIRAARARFRKGEIDAAAYEQAMENEIRQVVQAQEEYGLDVLVHGEPERTDMVEYFGQQLAGYCFTQNGWVQSYGSRCVKPPIIYGDVSRPDAMTVRWSTFAQSLTPKPMKGMLTGPVTMLCWSFVRDDQPRAATCKQLALAIRDEVQDLEAAGITVIQIDEPALREGLPLQRGAWEEYLSWAVESFRLTASGVADTTQIHTHMCYSEFNEIVSWIAAMDADVISIEASRSRMELLDAFADFRYPNEIGPGVYDIHTERVPTVEEMVKLLEKARRVIPDAQLWVNPDCGLKTRRWPEVKQSLTNMVAAAKIIREG